ncbi:TetR/AcrR family transcriptional regulator [Actinomadura madurae]|uniref:TetR/AcrR family transcriptional regulator n=1 Tax=Actinomadura madurae TaxID=1993 RepID=UPI002027328F|nr:TetR/AcrR family transcriptional regulator [Actinomadura madurae]MCP9947569.1 TetR/AcrR family transcriptional regulator [Actinomadura madurae]MCP9964333.1 TetR/AcrR family transcriptional regulator [Actinomadura madurae]MCQ0011696.1 TetR/AcrR family transcriptional regulator [Actinomadura madurae]URM93236.1 TetR/AcrR family transcriptional regulator [Actinomadura madurae]URN03961.1 TetR/AcrR family transcriptional regulator [Actinomadura madurae]
MGEHHLPGAGTEPEPGLRERKKRQTRRRISDIATGLFMTRGFDAVTIADVARAADVSVNTVFNYFKTKEDLFFDRQDEMIEAAGRDFRDRRPGESAAAVFRRRFFEGLDARSYQTAFHEGSEVWTRTVRDSPALTARSREMIRRAEDHLAGLLAEDTGAGPGDIAPRAAAAMILAVQTSLVEQIADRKSAGETLEEMREDVYAAAARAFDLLEHGLGGYAAAPPPTGRGKATAGRRPPENECRTAPGRSYTP